MHATVPAKIVTKTVSGSVAQVDRWGELQLTLVVKKTTQGKKVTRRITAVKVPLYPNHTNRSIYVNQQALPILEKLPPSATSKRNSRPELLRNAPASRRNRPAAWRISCWS